MQLSRGVHCKTSLMDRGGIEELLRRGQELSRSIYLVIERCRDCDKNHLNSSTDSLAIERCRAAIELLKNQHFFT